MPLIVLNNWCNKFIKTFDLNTKNLIKLIIGYSGIPNIIKLLYLKNLIKL
jgi:hypothetical protein